MPTHLRLPAIAGLLIAFCPSLSQAESSLRPPAVPLVTCDPYFSIWSPSNKLAESETTHWTGRPHRLHSTVTIDGQPWRLLGTEPAGIRPMFQTGVDVLPTRTNCTFKSPEIALTLTFTTPALPESIDLLSWPVTYVTYTAKSLDGKSHQVSVDFEAHGEITVNDVANQKFEWSTPKVEGLSVQAVGSETQAILGRSGDDLRIEWGYLYIAAPEAERPRWNEHKLTLDLGQVGNTDVSRWLMLAYDDLYSIQYMEENLRPYWRRNGWEAADLLKAAAAQYADLSKRCADFDAELMQDLTAAGGEKYARLCALSYRQCFAAGKFAADRNGQPLQFSKENHSNGCIATSDVFYPMAPQFLMFGPSLAKSFIVPFMNYAASDRWRFSFAPHDLGQYPLANGQVYGGGETSEENQMPVEECGNLLLLIAATCQMEGSPAFASQYWKQITEWANYLMEKGFDPENQLCTDDFAGHMAHNVNLSVKAICAIGAYAKLCEMRGEKDEARKATTIAKGFVKRWMEEALDGDHYRLAFDRKGTWSQKYNLIWDRILGLDLFPAEVASREMAFYRRIQNPYGLALDNRETYTKLDWITWTATLTQNRNDFEALIEPVIAFINESQDRSPLTDWYQTRSARKVGFTARPVVGGVFAQVLYDQKLWVKWAARDQTKAANWAALPKPPVVTQVVPTATTKASDWKYTTTKPADAWSSAKFDAKDWKTGKSGFGTRNTPGAQIGTEWNTPDIWLIRDVEIAEKDLPSLQWLIHHDEDTEIFVNGELAEKLPGYIARYERRPLSKATRSQLRAGNNRIAVHCHQTGGGQYIDVGFVTVETTVQEKAESQRIGIWKGHAPIGDGKTEDLEVWITVHRPANANGTAVVICPGGGYGGLVVQPEGHGIAAWLNRHGITGVVLEYRLPAGRSAVPLLDAQRAIRTVRANAREWKVDPARIGIIGFSAGGHLASTAATHFDRGDAKAADPVERVSCRPDFAILVYPVITMNETTHGGSRANLLGKSPTQELIDLYSNEKQVTDQTPPTFLAHARDDTAVVPANSQKFYDALKAHKVPGEYLELPSGGHGLNGYKGPMWDAWQERSLAWLTELKLLPRSEKK